MNAFDRLAVLGEDDEPFEVDGLTHDLAALLVLLGLVVACCAAWAAVIATAILTTKGLVRLFRPVAVVIWG